MIWGDLSGEFPLLWTTSRFYYNSDGDRLTAGSKFAVTFDSSLSSIAAVGERAGSMLGMSEVYPESR